MDTVDIMTLALTLALVLLTALYFRFRRPSGFPPGPPCIPGVGTGGVVPAPTDHTHLVTLVTAWRKLYGKVCGFSTGKRFAVIISDLDIAKEVFIRDGKDVSDRGAPAPHTNPYHPKTGVLHGNYSDPSWSSYHRAVQVALHDLVDIPPSGRATSRLEGRLARPLDELLGTVGARLSQDGGGDVGLPARSCVGQFMVAMLFGTNRKELTTSCQTLLRVQESLTTHADDPLGLSRPAELLARVTSLLPCVTSRRPQLLVTACRALHSLVFGLLGEHETRERRDQLQTHDFIDFYLKELGRQRRGQQEGQREGQQEGQREGQREGQKEEDKEEDKEEEDDKLFLVITELLEHGLDPVSTTLTWVMYHLVTRPSLQADIQGALDAVVGTKRLPRLKDRPNLGVIDAVISETLRLTPPLVVGHPHTTSRKVKVGEYVVPKDTAVYLNIWEVHRDPRVWKEPEQFDPTRFLNPKGRFINKTDMVAFGIGRRVCLGEQVSRQLLFLTVSNLLYKFTFSPPEGDTVREPQVKDGRTQLTVCATRREL